MSWLAEAWHWLLHAVGLSPSMLAKGVGAVFAAWLAWWFLDDWLSGEDRF